MASFHVSVEASHVAPHERPYGGCLPFFQCGDNVAKILVIFMHELSILEGMGFIILLSASLMYYFETFYTFLG